MFTLQLKAGFYSSEEELGGLLSVNVHLVLLEFNTDFRS